MARPRARPTDELERLVDGHRITFDRATSERMADIRRRDTGPELLVRKALSSAGLRYRVRNRDLPGSPDVANRTGRWAVFVHGCYWHRHHGCRRTTTPKRNAAFWIAKFDANVKRDARARRALRAMGFRVVTVWECVAGDPVRLRRALRTLLGDSGTKDWCPKHLTARLPAAGSST